MSYSNLTSNTCRVCMQEYQTIIKDIATEATPLLPHPRKPRRLGQRCTDRYSPLFIGGLFFITFAGMMVGFRLIYVVNREIEPSEVLMFYPNNWRSHNMGRKNEDLARFSRKLLLVYTNSPLCYSPQNCTREIRRLHEQSLRQNNSDLPYNFIITDDTIYEGTGWRYSADIPPYTDNSTIVFGILGYPGESNPTSAQKDQLIVLIDFAIDHYKLNRCFRMLFRPEEKTHLQDLADRIHRKFINGICE